MDITLNKEESQKAIGDLIQKAFIGGYVAAKEGELTDDDVDRAMAYFALWTEIEIEKLDS